MTFPVGTIVKVKWECARDGMFEIIAVYGHECQLRQYAATADIDGNMLDPIEDFWISKGKVFQDQQAVMETVAKTS